MTPQEQNLISALFDRLKQAGKQPKDAEAEALIRHGIAEQPDAPYLLVQTVLIQDMALTNAQQHIAELERQLSEAKSAPPPQPTSFLGAAASRGSVPSAGSWTRSTSSPSSGPAPSAPWGQPGAGQPMMGAGSWAQPMTMPSATSGFLRQAATTAAGIAGGALLFQGIQSLFGAHYGGMLSGMPMQPGISETVINNYYDQPGAAPGMTQAADTQNFGDQSAMATPDQNADFGGQDYASDQDFDPGQDFGGDDNFDV